MIPMAENFIRHYNAKFKRDIQGVSRAAAAMLLAYEWPGNVRELRNVIERAMVLEESEWIQGSSLHLAPVSQGEALAQLPPQSTAMAASAMAPDESMPFDVSLEEAEKNLLMRAMERAGGNQTRAAVLLGITRDTLRYKMKKFNLR